MCLANTITMPAGFSVIEADELTYLDGGAESGLWANWSFPNFIHGFTLALGSATFSAAASYILAKIPVVGIGGAFSAAGAAIAGFSVGQYAMLGICAAAAAYTFWYQVKLVYGTLEYIYYTIFPKKETTEVEAETELATNQLFAI